MDAFRGGKPLPLALRKYPYVHVHMRNDFISLIDAGMSAVDARNQVSTKWSSDLLKLELSVRSCPPAV